MHILNIEIKARTDEPGKIEQLLLDENASYTGEDHQVDTYFVVPRGRLKLREGKIENSLIYYHRAEVKDLKKSQVILQKLTGDFSGLKAILTSLHGVWKVVDKHRQIFFIHNVKFHVDHVVGLGSFVEIEAIDNTGEIGEEKLRAQCSHYMDLLGIKQHDLVDKSYSDLV